jgi:hypothetical protein
VDAAAFERVQIGRQRRDERLALARAHFGDLALVQHHAAHQLHVEVAHAEHALGGFTHRGERFRQHFINLTAARQTVTVLACLVAERLVRERFERRLERVDALPRAAANDAPCARLRSRKSAWRGSAWARSNG